MIILEHLLRHHWQRQQWPYLDVGQEDIWCLSDTEFTLAYGPGVQNSETKLLGSKSNMYHLSWVHCLAS